MNWIMGNLIEIRGLRRLFPLRQKFLERKKKQRYVHAVDGVSFDIVEGETLALVGESGCGKTTTGKLIINLERASEGKVTFMNQDVYSLGEEEMRQLRCHMQIVFQDVSASLNPRKTAGQIISQPIAINEKGLRRQQIASSVYELLEIVGLSPPQRYLHRYPHEFSGGQRQRIGIARAIALRPKFVVADEPVSALDISVRGQILNLLKKLQAEMALTYLFITHDLAVVRSIADRVAVMYLGKIVEMAPVTKLFENPLHPYTKALLTATPIPDPKKSRSRERIILTGDVPSPVDPPSGCRFHTRCWLAFDRCRVEHPELRVMDNVHHVACHLVE